MVEIILRKDIMDELGLTVPETREEFTAMLEKVHEAHPEMVAFCPKDISFVGTITSSFGFYFDWNDVEGKLENRVEMAADVLSFHTALVPATHHLLNADNIKLMKDDVIVVNTSRGAVIDNDAVAAALCAGGF